MNSVTPTASASGSLLPSFIFVEAMEFLPLDALIALALVNRGCHALSRNERKSHSRCQRYASVEASLQRIQSTLGVHCKSFLLLRSLRMNLADLSHSPPDAASLASNSTARRRSSLILPGLPEVSDPLEAVDVEWGCTFPTVWSENRCSSSDQNYKSNTNDVKGPCGVDWLFRDSDTFAVGGTFAKWMLGVAAAASSPAPPMDQAQTGSATTAVEEQLIAVTLGLLFFSRCGSTFSFSLTVVVEKDSGCRRGLHWQYDIAPDRVVLLPNAFAITSPVRGSQGHPAGAAGAPPQRANPVTRRRVDEALIASHPTLFGQWFVVSPAEEEEGPSTVTEGEPQSKREEDGQQRVSMCNVTPFSLLCDAHTTPFVRNDTSNSSNAIQQLLRLSDVSQSDSDFATLVDVEYFDRISDVVAAHQQNVFTIEEEFASMVTPKGVWTYPTGMAIRKHVDALHAWEQRKIRLSTSLRRNLNRGARDMFYSGWIPVGLLCSLI